MSKHLVHPGVAELVPLGRRPLDRLRHDRVPLRAVARHHGKQSGKQHKIQYVMWGGGDNMLTA